MVKDSANEKQNVALPSGDLNEYDKIEEELDGKIKSLDFEKTIIERDTELNWKRIVYFTIFHIAAVYGFYLMLMTTVWQTNIFAVSYGILAGFGIIAGAHRLWAHRCYKAKTPLKIFLMVLQTISFEESVFKWAKDHRTHHKHSDTDADPHNASRGFFYSHFGWILTRRTEANKAARKKIDISDLKNDKILVFQDKYYYVLMPILCFILPTFVPHYGWGESLKNSWFTAVSLRYIATLHLTSLVNSAAHLYGTRPYDSRLNPAENKFVSILALGEGWHNYHHTFPWDYKAAELGNYRFNFSTAFIDFFAKIGWAYDLKFVSNEMVMKRVQRTGDGSYANKNFTTKRKKWQ